MVKYLLVCDACGQEECFRGEWKCSKHDEAGVKVKKVKVGYPGMEDELYCRWRSAHKPIGIVTRKGSLWQG